MSTAKADKAEVQTLRVNEKKWSPTLMKAGWNVIPNIIIEKQQALGLDALDMNIILYLSHHWWQPDNLPHPSVGTIAKAIGVTERTVQKRIASMEAGKLIRREERRLSQNGNLPNRYNFDGLIEACKPFAEEKIAQLAKQKTEKEERLARKKPRLVVNNPHE